MFTEQQLENWKKYEAVRQSGVINMFDARMGCELSGLTRDEYVFCMSNYAALRQEATKE
jgi:hypothetical protein